MRHLGVTTFAGFVFLAVAFLNGLLPVSLSNVSQETLSMERYRETFSVKQGVSQDGGLAITKIGNIPTISPNQKAMNHERTLRAFMIPSRNGTPMLYIESVKPSEYYSLTGNFVLQHQYPALVWASATTLEFYARSLDGELMRYKADMHLLTLSERPADVSLMSESISSPNLSQ